jgi:hypothetical protein
LIRNVLKEEKEESAGPAAFYQGAAGLFFNLKA